MKLKKSIFYIVSVTVLLALTFGTALADDSAIFRRNISKTPAGETEYASMSFMPFTVPAQAADGTITTIEYLVGEDVEPTWTADFAKPLIASYIDDSHAEETLLSGISIMGGLSIGHHDAFVGHSLDDGETWKATNLSESADKSSFNLANGIAYQGDVYSVVQATVGNRVMAAWLSRYCDEGNPLYTLTKIGDQTTDTDGDGIADYGDMLQDDYGLEDLYLVDIWGVAGSQKSVDFTLQGFPEVGEIPYGCVWTARGTLIELVDDPETTEVNEAGTHDIVWTKPERLTSGVRDANRLEIDGVNGAGFAITWQEDPEGLRPGLGLGPGEGWSGAIVNAKTDIWYSYISWDHFNIVDSDQDDEEDSIVATTIESYFTDPDIVPSSQKPKVVVPMAMPVRLTDNNMCKSTSTDKQPSPAYCYVDFDDPDLPVTLPTTQLTDLSGNIVSDNCAEIVQWTTNGDAILPVCKTEDGRVLNGRVGSSRARMTLQPYTIDANDPDDKTDDEIGAWFIMAYEESKAQGEQLLGGEDTDTDPIEIGKNIWYHTFSFDQPEMVQQGGLLNQPTFFNAELAFGYEGAYATLAGDALAVADGIDQEDFLTLPELDQFGNQIFETEIARRFSLIAQPVEKIGDSRTSAYLLYKQGILNQGGPADIFARRIVVPTEVNGDDPATPTVVELTRPFDPSKDNPYAYEYIACDNWFYPEKVAVDEAGDPIPPDENGEYTFEANTRNPRYLQGFCGDPATNLSGNRIEEWRIEDAVQTDCYNELDPSACAATFPWKDATIVYSKFPKVAEWSQSGISLDGAQSDPYDEYGDQVEPRTFDNNLDDQSYENPYDVAKGHRGFLDGDFLFVMYAWSPNWNANSVGNDKYNLYVRRSFDGGQTWTTTPADAPWNGEGLSIEDESVTLDPSLCENYGIGGVTDELNRVCYSYTAGEFEQARNVSQLTGTRVTILDPRYTPSGGIKKLTLFETYINAGQTFEYEIPLHEQYDDPSDEVTKINDRDSSKFFVVYETGDNTTAAEGEPTPLDLFYSRATNYGDLYEWYDVIDGVWQPHEDEETLDRETFSISVDEDYRWPWLEKAQEDLSGEAALTASPSGDFLYADWSQWREDEYENVFDSDVWFRRLFYNHTVETDPTTSIVDPPLAAMFDTDQELVLNALAADYDQFGDGSDIVEYEWSVDSNIRADITGTRFNAPPRTLSNGWHTFSVRAKDNDGRWSRPAYVRILIVEDIHTVFMPMLKR